MLSSSRPGCLNPLDLKVLDGRLLPVWTRRKRTQEARKPSRLSDDLFVLRYPRSGQPSVIDGATTHYSIPDGHKHRFATIMQRRSSEKLG